MISSPDSPSIIAISITAIAFAIIGAGIKFSYVGTPATSAVPDAIAQKTTEAPAITVPVTPPINPPLTPPINPPVTIHSQEASIAKPEVRDMELWWQFRQMELWWLSTHRQRPQHNSPRSLDAAKLTKLSARIAEESWGVATGGAEQPRYLSDTSRWPLHGPANP